MGIFDELPMNIWLRTIRRSSGKVDERKLYKERCVKRYERITVMNHYKVESLPHGCRHGTEPCNDILVLFLHSYFFIMFMLFLLICAMQYEIHEGKVPLCVYLCSTDTSTKETYTYQIFIQYIMDACCILFLMCPKICNVV